MPLGRGFAKRIFHIRIEGGEPLKKHQVIVEEMGAVRSQERIWRGVSALCVSRGNRGGGNGYGLRSWGCILFQLREERGVPVAELKGCAGRNTVSLRKKKEGAGARVSSKTKNFHTITRGGSIPPPLG